MRALGALLLLCGLAGADDPIAARVDEVLRADAKALAEIAARPDIDPWLVADELRARGEPRVAEAFAAAVPGGEKLREGLGRLKSPEDARAREAVRRANAAVQAPDPAQAKAALEGLGTAADDIVLVRLETLRGYLARQVGELEDSEAAFGRAAAGAEALGWTFRQILAEREALASHVARAGAAGAREAILRCLARAEELEDRPGIAWASRLLGQYFSAQRQSDEAAAAFDRSAALWREVGAPAEASGALEDLYTLWRNGGNPAGALDAAQRLRAAWEAAGSRGSAVRAARCVADALVELGRLEEAAALYAEVQEEAKALGDLLAEADACSGLVGVRLRQGRPDEAKPLAKRAVDAATASGDVGALLLAKNMLGDVEWQRGHCLMAAAAFGESLELARKLKDPWREAIVLGNLGAVSEAVGDLPKALVAYEECLSRSQAIGDRAGEAMALSNRGHVLLRMGRPAEGRASCEASLAMDDPASRASTLARLALIHEKLGDFALAFQYDERAIKEARARGDMGLVGHILNNTAGAYFQVGDYDRALSYYEEALELGRKTGDQGLTGLALMNIGLVYTGRDPEEGVGRLLEVLRSSEESGEIHVTMEALLNLSDALVRVGKLDDARAYAGRAVALADKNGAARLAVTGRLMLARIERDRGGPKDALPPLLEAVARARELGEAPALVDGLADLAWSHGALGEWEEAISAAREATPLLAKLATSLEGEQASSSRVRYGAVIDCGIFAAFAAGRAEDAFFLMEWGRAGSFLEALGGRERLREAAVPPDLLMAEEAARAEERLALAADREALAVGVRAQVAERRAELERARGAVAEISVRAGREARLAAHVAYPLPATLEEMRGALAPDEALVLYAFASDRLRALVLDASGVRLADLGPAEPVAKACADLVRGGPEPAADELRARIFEPLRLPAAVKSLIVSPDGPLGGVPFCLLDPQRQVSFVPSATALLVMRREKPGPGTGILAIGDPAAPGAAPLPGARAEAKAVGDVVLLGADATEVRLAAAVAARPRWRAVHFACHGDAHREMPLLSALRLAPERESDGALTLIEIARLRFPTDLVALSACDTAPGALRAAEGVAGFPAAFLFAGASRVLVSLWKVDDAATRVLMERFYAHWREMPAAAALRAAQQDLRDRPEGKDPSAWAAWQLWGLPE